MRVFLCIAVILGINFSSELKANVLTSISRIDKTEIITSDVDDKLKTMRARVDSLGKILETKKADPEYADKIANIDKLIIQLSEFADQITMIEESQLSDGDKMMELVFVDYSLDGIEDDIKKLDETQDVAVVTNDVTTTNNNNTNTNTDSNTNTNNNTTTTTTTTTTNNTQTTNAAIARVNPANGDKLQLPKGYYVVVMAFGVYNNATNLYNNLKADGYSPGIIKNSDRGLFYVYSHYSESKTEAQQYRSTQASKYQGAWVFSY